MVVIAIVLVFFVLPLRMSWRSKGIIALITIVAPCKSYLHLLVGGDAFDPPPHIEPIGDDDDEKEE